VTPELSQQVRSFAEELAEIESSLGRAEARLIQSQRLFGSGAAARAELLEREAEADRLRGTRSVLAERQRNVWWRQLVEQRGEVDRLRLEAAELDGDLALQTVRSPVAGVVEEASPLSPGSFVQPGDRVAVVLPEAIGLVEIFISPRDLGRVHPGAPVRLLFDAYDHRTWGSVPASVASVGREALAVENGTVVRVTATLHRNHLIHPTGATVGLRSGLTFTARLPVDERSLLDLLRDRAADRLHPYRLSRGGTRDPEPWTETLR
jgi:membrane fusion protein, peptide pheromone/bacteriocin exporter